MTVYIAADHRGFALKEKLKTFLAEKNYAVEDLGNTAEDPNDDYPVFAAKVAEKVSADPQDARGIILCGSGVGVDDVANKFKHVRSALAASVEQVKAARHDDNVNVLSLAADFIDEDAAKQITQTFLGTSFSGEERFKRRIQEIDDIEE